MKKIVIIGAGPAGLTAAYEMLCRSDEYKVMVFEESGSIGGISRTAVYKNNRMDLGGHRFFSKIDRVKKMWTEIMPLQGAPAYDDKLLGRGVRMEKDGPDPEVVDEVMLRRIRRSRIYFARRFFDYPISAKVFGQMNVGMMFRAGFSYIHSCISKKDENCLEDFYINRFGRQLYSMFFEGYTEKLWGRHPCEISTDWGYQRVKGLSLAEVVRDVFTELFGSERKKKEIIPAEEFYYPKLGPGQLWELTADKIISMGGEVRMNCCVKKVVSENGRISGIVYEKDGQEFTENADIVISSMPIKDLVRGMENVPDDIRRIAEGLPYRDFVTAGILVDRLELKNKTKIPTLGDIVPDCWIYVQDTGVKMGRIQVFNNWSPYLVEKPEKNIWLGLEYFCLEGDEMWNMSDESFADMAASELVKMGVISDKSAVKDCHVEHVKKAYPAYFDTYSEMDRVIEFADSFGNLYCIGRNGQHRYNNMDHSMMTAFETVDNILSGKQSKENIWNVNTEKEYHEEKKA